MLWALAALRAKEETHFKNYRFLEPQARVPFVIKLAWHVLSSHGPSSLCVRSREVSIMKSLSHPNIIRLFEIIDSTKELYLIMEYAHGGDLFQYLVAHDPLLEEEARAKFHNKQYLLSSTVTRNLFPTEN
nr:MAP/microtubule affinity-regulating kinase 3-like [Dasypus novemcinctus]